jgi:hypothetical protein
MTKDVRRLDSASELYLELEKKTKRSFADKGVPKREFWNENTKGSWSRDDQMRPAS